MNRWTGACILAMLMACAAGVQAAEAVIVSVSPAVSTVGVGQNFSVNVRVDQAYLLHGSHVTVRFDKTVLAFLGATDGNVYTAVQPNPIFWWTPDTSVHADSVVVDQAILGTPVYTGSGTLFSVTFKAVASGSSAISLLGVDLRNNNNQSMETEVIDGTVIVQPVCANIKVFLQGPFSSGSMLTGLNAAGYIPLAQQYTSSPWLYAGTENVGSIPAGVVDWVLVELRTGTAAATKVATRAAFVKSDGVIVDLDGSSAVGFPGLAAGSYYVVVRHRNHLAVMSAGAVVLSSASALYDFSTGLDKYYGGEAKALTGGTFGMYAGDVTANGAVVLAQELTVVRANNLQQRYDRADVNMNGAVVLSQELTVVRANNLRTTKVP